MSHYGELNDVQFSTIFIEVSDLGDIENGSFFRTIRPKSGSKILQESKFRF